MALADVLLEVDGLIDCTGEPINQVVLKGIEVSILL